VIIELLAAMLIVLLVLGIRTVRLVSRLDRLHIRTDAAWAALDAALARRGLLARLASTDLKDATEVAESVPRTVREAAENEVSKLLGELDRARLPRELAAELAEAEHRMVLARRVHNDAVRDTRALRGRPLVRWLRLAGTAPLPAYFEIAEPVAELAATVYPYDLGRLLPELLAHEHAKTSRPTCPAAGRTGRSGG
jgi:hypothetical protein